LTLGFPIPHNTQDDAASEMVCTESLQQPFTLATRNTGAASSQTTFLLKVHKMLETEAEDFRNILVPIPSSDKVYAAIPSSSMAKEGIWADLACEGGHVAMSFCQEPSYVAFFAAAGTRQYVIGHLENHCPSLTPLGRKMLEIVDKCQSQIEHRLEKTLFHVLSPEAFATMWDGEGGDIEIPTRRVTGVPAAD
jgi:hypothetical protein